MLIISEDEFLNELKSDRFIADKSSNSSEITKSDSSETHTPNTNDVSENVESTQFDRVEMENHTYDNFRKPMGEPNTPKEVKAIIGALASEYKHDEVVDAFPVSKQTVGMLARDDHSNQTVKDTKNAIIERIQMKALAKIETSIEFLDISRDMKNTEKLQIAEGLSRVHEKVSPKNAPEAPNITQFIYYVPERQNPVESYEIVEAGQ